MSVILFCFKIDALYKQESRSYANAFFIVRLNIFEAKSVDSDSIRPEMYCMILRRHVWRLLADDSINPMIISKRHER